MATCNSCGGVVGKDCFNPEECAWITQQMAVNMQHQQGRSEQIEELQAKYEKEKIETKRQYDYARLVEGENANLQDENDKLKKDLKLLYALQAAGVDNWEGYESIELD